MNIRHIIATLAILLTTGCHKQPGAGPPSPPKVVVMAPRKAPVQASIELTGTIEAYRTVNLIARVEGTLTSVDFKDGSFVEKDDLLFTIQRDTYEEQLKLYEAQLENAEAEYQRQVGLAKQNATSVANVEKWQSQREQDRAQVALAKINLGYTRITAPFSGRIGKHLVDVGNVVGGAGEPTQLATLQQLQPIYLSFNMNEREVLLILKKLREAGLSPKSNVGKLPVFAQLATESGYPHKGLLDFAANEVDTSTGTLELRAEFPNKEIRLFPGLFARIRIPLGEPSPMLVIPNTAVSNDQAGDYVLTVDSENRVMRENVKTGPLTDDGMRAIVSGLGEENRVIVQGLLEARLGEVVTPVPAAAKPASSGKSTPSPSPAPTEDSAW